MKSLKMIEEKTQEEIKYLRKVYVLRKSKKQWRKDHLPGRKNNEHKEYLKRTLCVRGKPRKKSCEEVKTAVKSNGVKCQKVKKFTKGSSKAIRE